MAHLLKNSNVSVHIFLPQERYRGARYDWSGMIARVEYRGVPITGAERPKAKLINGLGQGFCNEFGIKTPIGYDELKQGDWFHKIGVGLLQRDDAPYNFLKDYPIQPAAFSSQASDKSLKITCKGALINGYAYSLKKEIHLLESGFAIRYTLKNTGIKRILTTEYNHNFLSLAGAPIGQDYQLTYPFKLDESVLDENINPEDLVAFNKDHISFRGTPTKDFFFSDLTGSRQVPANWSLRNRSLGINISETGDFYTAAVHLWGTGHVISPELYLDLDVLPGDSMSWTRSYSIQPLT